jgi:hypothetical protein
VPHHPLRFFTGMLSMKNEGVLYILTNPAFSDDLLKIGMSTRSAKKRAWELYENSTGVPIQFEVVYEKHVSNCEAAEEVMHKRLSNYRYNIYREFFKVSLNEAKKIIDCVVHEMEELYSDSKIIHIEIDNNLDKADEKNRESQKTFKSTENINTVCDKCNLQFSLTLRRYEEFAICPFCHSMQRLNIDW